jgi:cell division protein FtsB
MSSRMTKAQARRRINEAQKKMAKVYIHYSSIIGNNSTKDLEALNKIMARWNSKLR